VEFGIHKGLKIPREYSRPGSNPGAATISLKGNLMKSTVVKYGLRNKKTGKLLKYSSESNQGRDFCTDVTYELCEWGTNDWLIDSKLTAAYVRENTTEWYNAGYDTPQNDFDKEDLQLVKVTITTEEEDLNVELPTIEEIFKKAYEEKEPIHYKYVMEELKKRPNIKYDLYDLLRYYDYVEE